MQQLDTTSIYSRLYINIKFGFFKVWISSDCDAFRFWRKTFPAVKKVYGPRNIIVNFS